MAADRLRALEELIDGRYWRRRTPVVPGTQPE
jgi:hypothetical protein